MTEKRFRMETIGDIMLPFIVDNSTAKKKSDKTTTYHTYETHKKEKCLELVDLLNTLHEEIEYLKPRANENSNYIEDLEEDIIHYRQENEHIKHTIKEAIDNERTELGKSVLKQLLEAIQ